MTFPMKSHLPLITTRIEFQLKKLPLPPQITPRRDLGAHLRRQARLNSLPYNRPTSRCTSEEASVRNKSVRFNDHSLSPLSEIDSDKSGDEDNRDAPKIPKPKGEPGRMNSGGYNLKEALGWEEKRYSEFTVSYITPK
jgi:hypothetical protein